MTGSTPRTSTTNLEAEVQLTLADAHCRGSLHAVALGGGREVGIDADRLVAAASVFKVPVALEFFRQVAAGEIDPTEAVSLHPDRRTWGPTGISLFRDAVNASYRDLATLMLTISDNAATDVLLARVGLDRVRALCASNGMTSTRIPGDIRWLLAQLADRLGLRSFGELVRAPNPAPEQIHAAVAAEGSIATTARDSTTLLAAIWKGSAAPPSACAEVRRLMGRQLTRNRIASGFDRSVSVAAKSGTLLGVVRNEIAVVELPDGDLYAVAVFTTAWEPNHFESEINAAIGEVARLAVDHLRGAT